jgi:hypothetical protein
MNPALQWERAVVLTEVDAVGAEFEGEGEVVVEDEGDAGGAAEGKEFCGDAADGREVAAFGAELEEIGSAGEEGAGDGFGVFLGDVAEVEDAVEAGGVHVEDEWNKCSGRDALSTVWSGTLQLHNDE